MIRPKPSRHFASLPPVCCLFSLLSPLPASALGADVVEPAKIGRKVPNFTVELVNRDGHRRVGPADFHGKPLVIEFFATWCAPCKPAAEMLTERHKQLSTRGLQILAVSTEPLDTLSKYIEQHPVPYLVGRDLSSEMGKQFAANGLPTAVLINDRGAVVAKVHPNDLTEEALTRFIELGASPFGPSGVLPKPQDAVKFLEIELSKRTPSKDMKSWVNVGGGGGMITVDAHGQNLETILALALETSTSRIRLDPDLANDWYDMRYVYRSTDRAQRNFAPLFDAVARSLGLRITETNPEETVWVATHAGEAPRKGSGPPLAINMGDRIECSNLTMRRILSELERSHGVLIEDATALDGTFNLDLPTEKDWTAVCKTLSENYGLDLKEQKSPTTIYRVTGPR